MNNLLRAFVRVFGVADSESFEYYFDLFLGVVCAFATLILAGSILSRHIGAAFAVAITVVTLCLLAAKRRWPIVVGSLLFLAGRFVLAFLISGRYTALFLALLCGSVVLVGFRIRRSRL
jgi:hypothetical protein